MYEEILVEDRNHVRFVTLNRPNVLNAITRLMRSELTRALDDANRDDRIGCIVITGAGERAFAAGQDLNEAKEFSPERASGWIDEFHALYSALRNLDKTCIAAINGYAVGAGLQIALLADLRIAAETARMGMPELNEGLPCITGTWTLWDIVGRARTVDLVLTARLLTASEAHAWGLVNQIVPASELMTTALSLATEMASRPQTAIRMNKERWRQLTDASAETTRDFAKYAHSTAFASGEPQAAMETFLTRRKTKH